MTAPEPPCPPQHPGVVIREQLRAIGLKQNHVALELGISEKHLSGIVTGKARLQPEMAYELARVTGLAADALMQMQAHYDLAQLNARDAAKRRTSKQHDSALANNLAPYHQLIAVIEDLPTIVRETRRRRRMSLRDVEAMTGVALNTLSWFERRVGSVKVETVVALLRFVADETAPASGGD